MAKESVIGTITHEDVTVAAVHPEQRCTVASVAGHAMYERSNAYYEYFAGGTLDMTHCRYEQVDPKSTRVTGQIFLPTVGRTKVKLEGSGKVGERFIGIVGIRDPYSIQNIDHVIGWARSQVEEKFAGKPYQLFYNIYGKNGVMGDLEPVREIRSHGKTILLTTHFMEEAEKLCDRVAILDHGKIVALDTPANLISSLGVEERVTFSVDGTLPPAFTAALSTGTRVEVQGDRVTIHTVNTRQVPLVSEVVNLLGSQQISFHDLRTEQPNLEDVFLSLTGREMRE